MLCGQRMIERITTVQKDESIAFPKYRCLPFRLSLCITKTPEITAIKEMSIQTTTNANKIRAFEGTGIRAGDLFGGTKNAERNLGNRSTQSRLRSASRLTFCVL